MRSLASLMIDQKKLEAEAMLLKVRANRRGYVTKKDMEDFEDLMKKGEPIIEELSRYEGKELFGIGSVKSMIEGYSLQKKELASFYENTTLCKDGIYRTKAEMKAQGIKG
jgi:hypothetical protein